MMFYLLYRRPLLQDWEKLLNKQPVGYTDLHVREEICPEDRDSVVISTVLMSKCLRAPKRLEMGRK